MRTRHIIDPRAILRGFAACALLTAPAIGPAAHAQTTSPQSTTQAQAEAIVLSMTKWERRHPDKIDGKRRKRIARGSGTDASQVNQLLKQFFEARKIAKTLSTGKMPMFR